jgi:hypothetical protein
MSIVECNRPPIVQQGPLRVYFVTDVMVDVTVENVSLTFVLDQTYGGPQVIEQELCFRMVTPRSRFTDMREKITVALAEAHCGRH